MYLHKKIHWPTRVRFLPYALSLKRHPTQLDALTASLAASTLPDPCYVACQPLFSVDGPSQELRDAYRGKWGLNIDFRLKITNSNQEVEDNCGLTYSIVRLLHSFTLYLTIYAKLNCLPPNTLSSPSVRPEH
jgi:hypothetical protein